MKKLFNLIALFVLFAGCKQTDKPLSYDSQLVYAIDKLVYTIDKDGLYSYNLKNDSVQKLYTTDKVFLSDKSVFINDSDLIVGHQSPIRNESQEQKVYSKYFYRVDGDSSFVTDYPPYTTYDDHDFVTEDYFAVNVFTGKSYRCKTINYEHIDHSSLKISIKEFAADSSIINIKDTSIACSGTSSTPKGIRFCEFEGRSYSKSETVNNKQIISRRGDLIEKQGNNEKVILKYDGDFEPKFGSGYYQPSLSADGRKVCYQYMAGFLNSGSAIFEMNLETSVKKELLGEGYFNPKYSPDGSKILVAKNQRQGVNNTWINDLYLLDITSKKLKKLGIAEHYLWIPKSVKK